MEKETLFCSLSLLSYFDYDKTDVSVEVMLKEYRKRSTAAIGLCRDAGI